MQGIPLYNFDIEIYNTLIEWHFCKYTTGRDNNNNNWGPFYDMHTRGIQRIIIMILTYSRCPFCSRTHIIRGRFLVMHIDWCLSNTHYDVFWDELPLLFIKTNTKRCIINQHQASDPELKVPDGYHCIVDSHKHRPRKRRHPCWGSLDQTTMDPRVESTTPCMSGHWDLRGGGASFDHSHSIGPGNLPAPASH